MTQVALWVDNRSFESVKEAFVKRVIDEHTLKAALVAALNKLLAPVRKHFAENANAKVPS